MKSGAEKRRGLQRATPNSLDPGGFPPRLLCRRPPRVVEALAKCHHGLRRLHRNHLLQPVAPDLVRRPGCIGTARARDSDNRRRSNSASRPRQSRDRRDPSSAAPPATLYTRRSKRIAPLSLRALRGRKRNPLKMHLLFQVLHRSREPSWARIRAQFSRAPTELGRLRSTSTGAGSLRRPPRHCRYTSGPQMPLRPLPPSLRHPQGDSVGGSAQSVNERNPQTLSTNP